MTEVAWAGTPDDPDFCPLILDSRPFFGFFLFKIWQAFFSLTAKI
jgi:hypothetical protein